MFPAYRHRYLPGMTRARIASLPDKTWAPVLLAAGAIEQHGPHLPVAVDSLLGQMWVGQLVKNLRPGASCYVAPPITVGKSNEHVGFPGTLTISKDTLREQILVVAAQLAAWGFASLVVVNTHGGNSAVIHPTLREARAKFGLRCAMIGGGYQPDLPEPEKTWGFHAGEFETSLMLAVAPRLVRMEAAVREYPDCLGHPGELRPEFAPATFAWATQDISRTGVLGDAVAATAAKGARWIEETIAAQSSWLAEWCASMRASAPD